MTRVSNGFCDGISRRSVIQAGLTGVFGLSLADVLRLQAQSAESPPRRKAVIFFELAGGPAQHETYDPKPLAPKEFRGPLPAIGTAIAGVQFSALMAQQAKIADRLVVVRSIRHKSSSHQTSSHFVQTGYYLRDPQSRENDMPCIGSIAARVRGANAAGVPAFVSIPSNMRYGRAAWLGKGFNALETVKNADAKNFEVPNLSLLKGIGAERLEDRRALLSSLDATRRLIDNDGVASSMDQFTAQAFEMVSSNAAREAFEVNREDEKTRRRYGKNAVGQNVLLARRLVERGVTFVSVRVPGWDDHTQIKKRMQQKGPNYDRALAALVGDLHERGLDKDVLVVAMGEFGRTPRVNKTAGRDHWGQLMSVVLAGGGLRGGQVIGASDSNGSTVIERPYSPQNVLAVAYRHLGIDTSLTFPDHSGRPRYVLEEHEGIAELA
jgi:hypothetical protein